jgi:hypothetical protein
MPDIIAIVEDPTGSSTGNDTTVVASQTSVSPNTIENMLDVDLQGLTDGALLVYKNNTAKWTAGTILEKQIMEGGQY